MVTLEDVAVLAGVSRATVSRVVNGDTNVKALTREKVEQLSPFSVIPRTLPHGHWHPAKVIRWGW